jgi:hypothetical protein
MILEYSIDSQLYEIIFIHCNISTGDFRRLDFARTGLKKLSGKGGRVSDGPSALRWLEAS